MPAFPPVNDAFATYLPVVQDWLRVADLAAYCEVPGDWWVLITDVVASTQNVRDGRYRDVNAVGAASIIAALNAAREVGIGYVFGGDGALLLGPPACRAAVEQAVGHALTLAREAFGLELRAGLLPLADLRALGGDLHMLGLRQAPGPLQVMLDGPGVRLAEDQVKDSATGARWALSPAASLDTRYFAGFECRWHPIASQRGQIVTLLVLPLGDRAQRATILDTCLRHLAQLAGDGLPLREEALHLSFAASTRAREASVTLGRRGGWEHLRERLLVGYRVGIGQLLTSTRRRGGTFDGATYKRSLLERTDHRKYDGVLRMVCDLAVADVEALRAMLDGLRAQGHIAYGLHTNASAVLTCFVRDYAAQHVHFVDGSDGGYAMAAQALKQQLQ